MHILKHINKRQRETGVCSAVPLRHTSSSPVSFRAGIDLSSGSWAALTLRHAHALLFLPALPFFPANAPTPETTSIFQTEQVVLALRDLNQNSFLHE